MRAPVPRRGGEPSWMRPITDRLSRVIKYLIIANAFVFAFYIFVGSWQDTIRYRLALSPSILTGDFWQPLTSLFVHIHPIAFLFNMFGLWFVGAEIERQIGTRRFLTLFFGIGVVANLVIV